MEVLSEVCTFPDTKDFIDEKLEEKCARESSILVGEVIYFSLLCFINNESLSLT